MAYIDKSLPTAGTVPRSFTIPIHAAGDPTTPLAIGPGEIKNLNFINPDFFNSPGSGLEHCTGYEETCVLRFRFNFGGGPSTRPARIQRFISTDGVTYYQCLFDFCLIPAGTATTVFTRIDPNAAATTCTNFLPAVPYVYYRIRSSEPTFAFDFFGHITLRAA